MTLYQGDYGNMVHGVSQQPDERKAKGQLREQINCRSHLTDGLTARGGFEFVSELQNIDDLSGAKWVAQERGDGVAFIVAYGYYSIYPFDLTGDKKNFSFVGNAESYYAPPNARDPREDMQIASILDTTFITNRTVVPLGSNASDTIDTPSRVTWIEFKTFQAGTEIEIAFPRIVDGTTNILLGAYEAEVFDGYVTVNPSDGVPDETESVRTREFEGSYHAEQFVIHADSVYVTSYNNWVRIEAPETAAVDIVKGGESIILHENKSIEAIEKIPPFAVEGDTVVVESARDEEKDLGYFVAVSKKGVTTFSEVAWNETTATGSVGSFNADTMPHRMIRDNSDNFTLEAIPWADRQVGDSNTNPYPTFIDSGNQITNVGLFQNRLFLTSGEVVFLSASDSFYDLWRESAFYLTDADPFEKFADTNELNIIKYSEEFDGDLILFSDNSQFTMSGAINQTYKTAAISSVSQFKADLLADPVLSGDNIFFGIKSGSFAGVRELYTDGTDSTKRALPITEHVDRYIGNRLRHLATSTNVDALIGITKDIRSPIYIYEWKRDLSGELQQQAWHSWEFDEMVAIQWVGFIDSVLYATIYLDYGGDDDEGSWQLWKMDWNTPATTNDLDFPVMLDGRFEISNVTYNSSTNTSTWTAPYDSPDLVFIEGQESDDSGFEVSATYLGNNSWEAVGFDLSNITLIGGLRYTREIELPTPQMRDTQGVAKTVDRLQLSKLYFHFTKVGQMKVTISDAHGREREVDYINRRIGSPFNQPSYINTAPDTWEVGVRKKTEGLGLKLTSDDITPFTLRAIEWSGNFKQKGRRA